MKILELFAGSCSFSDVAKEYGHETFTVDSGLDLITLDHYSKIDLITDILEIDLNDIPFKPDFIWASPPCTYFSVSSMGKHWNGDNTPKSKEAVIGIEIVKKTKQIIELLLPMYFVIENPRGKLRKLNLLDNIYRDTVTYCQYGDIRMKPTDLWHNLPWKPKPICKNGMPCHVAAPRGSQTGTQGLKNKYEKSKVPKELCKEILESIL